MAEERRHGPYLHLEKGGLHGWCAHCSEEERHEALRRAREHSSYATVIRRLNALRRVDHEREPGVARVAKEDEHWMERLHEEGMI